MRKHDDPEELGSALDWKQFESFAESAFLEHGFETERNARFRKPRAEIDLVASKSDIAFAVDCKHWKRTVGHSTMLAISNRQFARAERLIKEGRAQRVIPVVITLHDESLSILENGVPVVPIHRISDFILNWEIARNELAILTRGKERAKRRPKSK